MTDKQIIFDDVEVKNCIAYAKSQTVYLGNTLYNQAENICMVKNQPCKFFDCQFKQMARELKRKEQECERWKSNFNGKVSAIEELLKQLDQLKAENEQYKKMLEDEEVILALNEVRTGERHLWFNKAEKYKQTLTEIKEIVFPKNQLIITDSPIILKIQEKISEVIE